MRKINLILLIIVLIVPSAFALFEFDEFTDDFPQLVQETVENENGNPCTDCNVSITITFINGTFKEFHFMPYNVSSSKYEVNLNLTLIDSNTTTYPITITSNRTSTLLFNGTSDRTQLTIYDVYPPADDLSDVAIVAILITITGILVYLAINFDENHFIIKNLFFGFAVGLNLLLFRIGDRILSINSISSTSFSGIIESSTVISTWLVYLFSAYLMIYVGWILIRNIMINQNEYAKGRFNY